ncbi:transglutaminase domain-containing protein [Streptomyces sp. ISL-100]|uniref:transglutaminase domain-containing protein n=1 Tax=Streptomyces sp. ISL-100 TaxID=2819173 RepID=UPI001BEACADC|nr:transglutaminase domain-containing protein [Streptomyces sp. ISL-100]MBT2394588.1 transglutaminase [Streptomyces sp. ISL-100]
MELIQESPDLSAYLAADDVIDHEHPLVRETAGQLRAEGADAYTYAKAAYEFVRDTIPHSSDVDDIRVTWRASDVIAQRTGICYAKAHALAALLRAEGIPTALCYQRLTDDDGSNPVIHGLVAVKLPGSDGWARQDPRGNKPGVDARFSLERERLAFAIRPESGEVDYPVLYASPHPAVLRVLRAAPDRPYLWRTLPAAL